MGKIQEASFDSVLLREGNADLVKRLRTYKVSKRGVTWFRLIRFIVLRLIPFICRELVFVAMNNIPVVGSFMVLYLRAARKGYRTQRRYYRVVGWSDHQIRQFYRAHRGDHTGFGLMAVLLELIPGLFVFFVFTDNIGMALWTVENHTNFSKEVENYARVAPMISN